jgi:Flp pilus assembly pilin Flp
VDSRSGCLPLRLIYGRGIRGSPGRDRSAPGASGVGETQEKFIKSFWKKFRREESGQDLIEYTLLMAFVALASASIFIGAGNSVNTIWQSGSNSLSSAAVAAS